MDLDSLLIQHQEDFSELLGDTFSEKELEVYEDYLDELSVPIVQGLSLELTFDDFEYNLETETEYRHFFSEVKSSLLLENVADLQFNPFQVTYINEILRSFDEVLIDRGGFYPLMSKKPFLELLRGHKNIFSLIKSENKIYKGPVLMIDHPIDKLISDIYRELIRLGPDECLTQSIQWPEKVKILYFELSRKEHHSQSLIASTKLSPKDFGDNLEKLKFILKKIN